MTRLKRDSVVLSLFLGLLLSGCAKIPEYLSDFVTKFSYERAVEEVTGATLSYVDDVSEDDAETGKRTIDYTFDKSDPDDLSAHYLAVSTGKRISPDEGYPASLERTLVKRSEPVEEEGILEEYDFIIVTGGETKTIPLTAGEALRRILMFFAKDPDEIVKAGGLYYGDHIKQTITRNLDLYTLDEENGTLTYDSGEFMQKSVAVHEKITVDERGMLLSLEQTMDDGKTFFKANCSVTYTLA